ncbi:hypothetical protein F8M41_012730 [Gigaspora margarita]|uniref:Uncharacterized protein n=1 Tax=Gigaspora margarita TaxID=4874 RepID=A0A8H4A0V5_GIGMA|nr:hypothetical protein F8M41_012730 [Gigaspora margarita]
MIKWEEVKLFWKIVENEKVDLDERLLKKKLEQAKTQFAVDHYASENEAHVIADKSKLDYMLDLNFPSALTTPSSDITFTTPPFDTSLTTIVANIKYMLIDILMSATLLTTPPLYTSLTTLLLCTSITTPTLDTPLTISGNKANTTLNEMKLDFILNQKNKPIMDHMRLLESWLCSKEKSNSGNIFFTILPNSTILQKPLPTPDFISLSDDENDNTLIVDNDNDEDISILDNIFCFSLPTNIQN